MGKPSFNGGGLSCDWENLVVGAKQSLTPHELLRKVQIGFEFLQRNFSCFFTLKNIFIREIFLGMPELSIEEKLVYTKIL